VELVVVDPRMPLAVDLELHEGEWDCYGVGPYDACVVCDMKEE
jgi:hypothetical protein